MVFMGYPKNGVERHGMRVERLKINGLPAKEHSSAK